MGESSRPILFDHFLILDPIVVEQIPLFGAGSIPLLCSPLTLQATAPFRWCLGSEAKKRRKLMTLVFFWLIYWMKPWILIDFLDDVLWGWNPKPCCIKAILYGYGLGHWGTGNSLDADPYPWNQVIWGWFALFTFLYCESQWDRCNRKYVNRIVVSTNLHI